MQFTLNSFYVMSYHFFIEQNINKSFMSFFLFTPLAFVNSSSSTLINEYIFDFNPINLLTFLPLNSSFILPKTFLLTESKNFESNG